MTDKQVKRFCFTLNNYTPDDVKNCETIDCGFIVYGFEVAPTTGTPHLQGYIETKKKMTMKALTKLMPRCSFQVSKGTADQNEKYCSKSLNYIKRGVPMRQGERSDLNELKDAIMSGKTVDDICVETPELFHQYGRTLTRLEDIRNRKVFRKEITTCTWYYGGTGTGKTHLWNSVYTPETHYVWADDKGWQDAYAQQHTVVIDEFRQGTMPYKELLTMADKTPMSVRRRGVPPLPFTSKHIIITSSLHPREVYCNLAQNDKLEQLYRRIEIIHMTEQYKDVSIKLQHGFHEESVPEDEEDREETLRFEQEI